MQRIARGSILSYSAGSGASDPAKFRIVQNRIHLGNAGELFPNLQVREETTPLFINAYPASFGSFDEGIFVDTYLRRSHFSRALELAGMRRSTAILMAQPLVAWSFLRFALKKGLSNKPKALIVAIGGYWCPLSLECALRKVASQLADRIEVIHAYGTAELDYGCLMGCSRDAFGRVLYKLAVDERFCRRIEGKLQFVTECQELIDTGDEIEIIGKDEFVVQAGKERLCPEVASLLESWTLKEWDRYTGYLRMTSRYCWKQVHKDVVEKNEDLAFYEFCHRFGMDYSCKPDWKLMDC